jgi:hypothetical protein
MQDLTKKQIKEVVKSYLKTNDMRIVKVRTPDGHIGLNVLQQADRFVRIARNRMLQPGYDAEVVLPLIQKYRDNISELNNIAKELARLCKMEYIEPKMFSQEK